MSNRYEAAVRVSVAPLANAAYLELRNTSARRLQVEEIGVFLGAATATGAGLVRATTQGTVGTVAPGQAEDPNQAAAAASLVGSPTAPGIGTNFMRRAIIGAAIGGGIIWTWPGSDRLIVPPSGSLLVTNIAAAAGSAVIDAYAVWIE